MKKIRIRDKHPGSSTLLVGHGVPPFIEIDFFSYDWYCKVTLEFQVKREVCSIKGIVAK